MPGPIDQLLRDICLETGAALPAWLEDDAPLLQEPSPSAVPDPEAFYLVGLIGGKDVGKSALVNALAGQSISQSAACGPGTEDVVAYCHCVQAQSLGQFLDCQVPGHYRIVTHEVPGLLRQVLLDLPDIDSLYVQHISITRRMLRHMLFPIWVQSIEKYADGRAQELLGQVAAGNAPANFIFCLNKVDQLPSAAAVIAELRDDYARRLAHLLMLAAPPPVWAVSALRPGDFDLPCLRQVLGQQKTPQALHESHRFARLQQQLSALAWLDGQDLSGRLQRLVRLEAEAEELIGERIGMPLINVFLPGLAHDPAHRRAILDEAMALRVQRWPIINMLHPVYRAIGALVRRNIEPRARVASSPGGDALIEAHLADLACHRAAADESLPAPRTLETLLQTTFAQLQRTHPSMSQLYNQRKLWEPMAAAAAVGDMRQSLARMLDRQRREVCARLGAGRGRLAAAFRLVFTLGALIWFPFLQPICHELLARAGDAHHVSRALPLLLVEIFNMNNLLDVLGFFFIYYTLIWLFLRWHTQRRIDRSLWPSSPPADAQADLSLPAQVADWLSVLMAPIRVARQRLESLVRRVDALRSPP